MSYMTPQEVELLLSRYARFRDALIEGAEWAVSVAGGQLSPRLEVHLEVPDPEAASGSARLAMNFEDVLLFRIGEPGLGALAVPPGGVRLLFADGAVHADFSPAVPLNLGSYTLSDFDRSPFAVKARRLWVEPLT